MSESVPGPSVPWRERAVQVYVPGLRSTAALHGSHPAAARSGNSCTRGGARGRARTPAQCPHGAAHAPGTVGRVSMPPLGRATARPDAPAAGATLRAGTLDREATLLHGIRHCRSSSAIEGSTPVRPRRWRGGNWPGEVRLAVMIDMDLATKWCGPELQGSSVQEVVAMSVVSGEDIALVLTGRGRRGSGPAMLLSAGTLKPLVLPQETLPRISRVWSPPGPPSDELFAVGPALDAVYRLRVAADHSTRVELVLELPENTDSLSVWVCPRSASLTVAIFRDDCDPIGPDDPRVEPPPPRPLTIAVWSSDEPAWRDLCQTPRESSGLCCCATAVAWLAYNNYISEESSAGAFYGIKLTAGSAIEALTPSDRTLPKLQSGQPPAGAGKVRSAAFTPDGESLILHANFSVEHAVTAACGLWSYAWPSGDAQIPQQPQRLTAAGHEIQKFGFGKQQLKP